jgi:Tfp pilus assembly protein PilF
MDTISLSESLLERGRELLHWHRPDEARPYLGQVVAIGETATAFEAHMLLADWEMKHHRLRRCRLHLREALKLQPNDAEAHYRYAEALDTDMHAEPYRAWKAIRRALHLNREEAKYWALYGQVALRMNQPKKALWAFRQASQFKRLGTDVFADVLDGLCALNRKKEAYARLIAARFQAPHDQGIQRVWEEFQLGEICRAQEADAGNHILPFPTTTNEEQPAIVRRDRGSKATPHLFRLPRGGFPKFRHS